MDTIDHMTPEQALRVLTAKPCDFGNLARPEFPRLGRVEFMGASMCPQHGMEGIVACEDVGNAALSGADGSCSMALPMPIAFAERLALGGERERTHVERVMRAEWN